MVNPIHWLDQMIDRAFDGGVSDLHLEYIEKKQLLDVRVRRDGRLFGWPSLEGSAARAAISRIKSKSAVGSGSVRKSEEGRYVHYVGSGNLPEQIEPAEYEKKTAAMKPRDLRLVVLPSVQGEKHVLRLPSLNEIPRVSELGFSDENKHHVARLLNKPNGLILFAGPVNAGKTTSMYSALGYMGGPTKAVFSVEDPVERSLDNVTQIEVNDSAGNTYASVLKSLRRADLEVLMIGEIRDQETAKAAIQISIAGTRVLSSIHANDSVAAIEAMLALSNSGPVQVMQSLRGVISQRLVPQLHEDCRGAGCPGCANSGVKGRLAFHEVLPVTPELSAAVASGASRPELTQIATASGMRTLRQDVKRLIDAGTTKPEWVAGVLGND